MKAELAVHVTSHVSCGGAGHPGRSRKIMIKQK